MDPIVTLNLTGVFHGLATCASSSANGGGRDREHGVDLGDPPWHGRGALLGGQGRVAALTASAASMPTIRGTRPWTSPPSSPARWTGCSHMPRHRWLIGTRRHVDAVCFCMMRPGSSRARTSWSTAMTSTVPASTAWERFSRLVPRPTDRPVHTILPRANALSAKKPLNCTECSHCSRNGGLADPPRHSGGWMLRLGNVDWTARSHSGNRHRGAADPAPRRMELPGR